MKKIRFFAVLILPLLMLIAMGTGPVRAADVVKVGISEYPGYAEKDADGNLCGADVEYAYKIAQTSGMKIEVVLINDAGDYFGALDSGKVDMLFDTLKNDEREEKYLFSEYEVGSSPQSIYVRKDDSRFQYGDTAQLNGKTFGSEADSYVTDLFRSWCDEHGLTVNIREYAGSDAIDAALDAGEIDAGVYGTDTKEGYRTIQLFSPTPYYIIFRKESQALKNKVDDAMGLILAADPTYEDKLIDKYIGPAKPTESNLTDTEKAYIKAHPTLKVAVLKNDQPFYSQKADGSEEGVLVDFYKKIGQVIGAKFTFVSYNTQADAIAAIKSGGADVIGMYSDSIVKASGQGLRLTTVYATVDVVMVTPAGRSLDDIKTVAVKKRSIGVLSHAALIAGGNIELKGYNTAMECFEAIKSGQTDAMVSGMPSATWLVNQANAGAYSITPLSDLNMDMCGAVDENNTTLGTIMNKGIEASVGSYDTIVTENTLQANTWETFISRIPPWAIVVFAMIMISLVAGLAITVVGLVRHQREKAALDKARLENEQEKARLAAVEKVGEERSEFFAGISHDMRTPLNAIIGFSRLAQEKAISGEVRDYLSKIQTSGNLLLDLISDTLTVSKMNSGKLTLHPQPVETDALLESIAVPVRASAEAKGLTFILDNQIPCARIMADRLNTEKIFLNLLSNAVKYTPEGGHVRFAAALAEGEEDGDRVAMVFTVADDGIGISADFLPHIYETFVQENREGESSGTGLGLSIVRQLITMMDGTIDVESTKGKGTTFTVRLSFEKAAGPSESEKDGDGAGDVKMELAGRKVLLCEDNSLNREIACALLKAKGMTVDNAENGQVGVDLFTSSQPGTYDAVLMDLRMPVMDGYQATRSIRGSDHPDGKSIPIIAMSADTFDDDIRKCLDAGMNDHVPKPVDPARLYSALASALPR